MTEGRNPGWASKIETGPLLSSKSGSATGFKQIYRDSVPLKPCMSEIKNLINMTSYPESLLTLTCA